MDNSDKVAPNVEIIEEHLTINSIESVDDREEESVKNTLVLEDFQNIAHETHDRESPMDVAKKLAKYKTMVDKIFTVLVNGQVGIIFDKYVRSILVE